MMWQVSSISAGSVMRLTPLTQASEDTQLHFVKTYWPEFGLTDMLPILLGWQQKQWLSGMSRSR